VVAREGLVDLLARESGKTHARAVQCAACGSAGQCEQLTPQDREDERMARFSGRSFLGGLLGGIDCLARQQGGSGAHTPDGVRLRAGHVGDGVA
jgi:hypothetical protein